jgi:hypothetical protein
VTTMVISTRHKPHVCLGLLKLVLQHADCCQQLNNPMGKRDREDMSGDNAVAAPSEGAQQGAKVCGAAACACCWMLLLWAALPSRAALYTSGTRM